MCWCPIGVLGLLAFFGVPISGEIGVAMSICVVPLNSAMNPFLYTINMVLEKRRQTKEDQLLAELKQKLRSSVSGAG